MAGQRGFWRRCGPGKPPLAGRLSVLSITLFLFAGCSSAAVEDSTTPTDPTPETSATPPTGPDHQTTVDPAVRVETANCLGTLTGNASGTRLDSGLVATVAHAFEVRSSIVLRSPGGDTSPAELAYLDLERDIALLRPTTIDDGQASLALGRPRTGPVEFLTWANRDLGPQIEEGAITRLAQVTLDGVGERSAARLRGDINPGDSGAGVVQDGQMVAMVFASTRNTELGWSISADEIESAIERLDREGPNVDPIEC